MWHELDPVFWIDIAIFGSSVGPYAVLSTTGVSWIWSLAHVDPSAVDAADEDADGFGVDRGDPEAGDDAAAEADEEDADDDAEPDAVGSADVAPLPRPTTISTTTTTMSRSTPTTVARRRQ